MTLGLFTWLLGTTDHNLPRREGARDLRGLELLCVSLLGNTARAEPRLFQDLPSKHIQKRAFGQGRGILSECSISLEKTRLECHQAGMNTIPRTAQQYASAPGPASLPGDRGRAAHPPAPVLSPDRPRSQLYLLLCGDATPSFPPSQEEGGRKRQLSCWKAEERRGDALGSTCVH